MNYTDKSKKRIVTSLSPLLSRTDGTEHYASAVIQNVITNDGGPGSGNWGHEGRPGEVGGSAEGGGKHNRIEKRNGTFTSFAKRRAHLAKPHEITKSELDNVPKGTKIIGYDGSVWTKYIHGYMINSKNGEVASFSHLIEAQEKEGNKFALAIQKSANSSFKLPHAVDSGKSHIPKKMELESYPVNTVITGYDGMSWKKLNATEYWCTDTGEVQDCEQIAKNAAASKNKVKIQTPAVDKKRGCKHDSSCFTDDRRRNANDFEEPRDADKLLRGQSGRIWRTLDSDVKEGFDSYTASGYRNMNSFLRGTGAEVNDHVKDQIKGMTDAIGQAALEQDLYLSRGVSMSSVAKMLGCSRANLTEDGFLKTVVGRTMHDDAFMSCGTTSETGMEKNCRMSIYCPKGTKALYAEPFSHLGEGKGINWDSKRKDGISEQTFFSDEFETILQRGTTVRIRSASYEKSEGSLYIECEVIEQDPQEI